MTKKKTLEEKRIARVSHETGIPEDIVQESINIMFKYIRGKIESPVLIGAEPLSSEDFAKKVPIMKIPGLGFMVPSYRRYLKIKENESKKPKNRKDGK